MAQMSPFQLFGMKPAFMIDEAKLEAAYQAAMMKVHPDRFADRPAAERRVAEQWSTRINEAFKLLKSPVKRAAWLCENAGRPIEAETNTRHARRLLHDADHVARSPRVGRRGAADAVRAEAAGCVRTSFAGLPKPLTKRPTGRRRCLTRRLMFIDRFLEEAARDSK